MDGATKKLRRWTEGTFRDMAIFRCPGCNMDHSVVTRSTVPGPVWGWNGSDDAPTFTPSILVRGAKRGVEFVCHSFVTNGSIQFLEDCTHALAGQTVPLPVPD